MRGKTVMSVLQSNATSSEYADVDGACRKHLGLECRAYRQIRSRYRDVFGDSNAIFYCDHQDQLAHAVYTMMTFRDQ
jgi:hypothetical protein